MFHLASYLHAARSAFQHVAHMHRFDLLYWGQVVVTRLLN